MNNPTSELALKPQQFLSTELAQFAASLCIEDIPEAVRLRAKYLIPKMGIRE